MRGVIDSPTDRGLRLSLRRVGVGKAPYEMLGAKLHELEGELPEERLDRRGCEFRGVSEIS